MSDPLFLTYKLSVNNLSSNINVYDFQLRDHFLNNSNLYTLQCSCANHKHNKHQCIIVHEPICSKCKSPTKLLISYQATMFHPDMGSKKLTRCCKHLHTPPCMRCINCKTDLPCIIAEPFECDISSGRCFG